MLLTAPLLVNLALAFVGTSPAATSRLACTQTHQSVASSRAAVAMGRRGQPPAFANRFGSAQSGAAPPLPEDGIPVFYLFVRSPQIGLWYPVSALKGDKPTRALVDSYAANGLGAEMAKSQIDTGIARSIFSPDTLKSLTAAAVKQYKPLKKADTLEWGYKIGDKALQDKVKAGEMEEPKITLLDAEMAKDTGSKVGGAVQEVAGNIWKSITGGN